MGTWVSVFFVVPTHSLMRQKLKIKIRLFENNETLVEARAF
jgi:hypothetical protein